MRFYVSWYRGDPWYPNYEDNCAVLISVTSVSQKWTLQEVESLPQHLILDSGGYRYAQNLDPIPTPKNLFQRQLEIVADTDVPTLVCALDFPIMDSDLPQTEKDAAINQTIAHAYEFKSLLSSSSHATNIDGIAIVQGYDFASLRYCAHELKLIGFQHFGLGSLAPIRYHDEVISRVEAVIDIVGKDLHVFGIGAMQTLQVLQKLGVHSVDTSRPAKAAIYNQVFYSNPFRYYAIAASRDRSGRTLPKDRRLRKPLQCECPICKGDTKNQLLKLGRREYVFARTLHNYWHLKQTIEKSEEI